MSDSYALYGLDGALRQKVDARTLNIARGQAFERLMAGIDAELAKLDDGPTREAQQWIGLALLQQNAGTAFASWPAGDRAIWNAQVKPGVDAVVALRARIVAARQAIAAATTVAQADAVGL